MADLTRALAAAAVICGAAVPPGHAAPVTVGEYVRLNATDGTDNDQFGRGVAFAGDAVLVGAPGDDDAGLGAGSVYVFRFDADAGWREDTKLFADDAQPQDEFGRAIDANADTLVVGAPEGLFVDAPQGAQNTGSAYVFARNAGGEGNWGQVAKLLASDGQAGDDFGRAVAINDVLPAIVVGARFDGDAGGFSGAAFLFEPGTTEAETWVQTQKLTPSGARADAYYGEAVAMRGDTILVGAPGSLFGATEPGEVYVFTPSPFGWLETAILTSPDTVPGDRFGSAVAIDGDTAAVGAFGGDVDKVLVFEREPGGFAWAQAARLEPPCLDVEPNFGARLDVLGDLLVVGAPAEDTASQTDAGALYVYERDLGGPGQWGLIGQLVATDGASLDQFGVGASIGPRAITIGAPGNDLAGPGAGAAYVWELVSADVDLDGTSDLEDNCLLAPNGPALPDRGGWSQRDTDGDGFGNVCDPDYDNDCLVNFADLGFLKSEIFGNDADADLDGDGQVDFADLAVLKTYFFAAPGPSAQQSCDAGPTAARPILDGSGVQLIREISCARRR